MDEEILPMSRDKHPQKAHHVFVEGDGDSASPTSAFCVGGSSAQQYRTHRKRAAASLSDSSDKEDVMRARRSPVSPCDGDSFTSLTTDRLATYQISSSPSCDTDLPCVDFAVRSGSGRKRKSPHNSSLDAKECFGTKPEDSPSDASQTHRLFFSTRRTVRDAVCAAFSGPPKLAPGGTPSSRLECLTQMYQNQASHWALQTGPRGSADIVKRAATILGFAEALRTVVDWRPEHWQSWPSALTILLQAAWKTVVAKSAPVALPQSVAKAIRSACRPDGSLLISPT